MLFVVRWSLFNVQVCCSLFVVRGSLLVVCQFVRLLFVDCCLLCVVCSFICYALFVVCYLLRVVERFVLVVYGLLCRALFVILPFGVYCVVRSAFFPLCSLFVDCLLLNVDCFCVG